MSNNTIILRGARNGIRKESIAGGFITPGYLLERATATTVVAHNSAGINAQSMFALENEVVGGDIDTDYAANDTVLMGVYPPGVEVYALVAAAASAIAVGDYLESAGDGTLRLATADAATDTAQRVATVAVALEAVNNSGGGAEARIKVELV